MFHKNPDELLTILLVTLSKVNKTVEYSLQFGSARRQDINAKELENNLWSTKLQVAKEKNGVFKSLPGGVDIEEKNINEFVNGSQYLLGSHEKWRMLIIEKNPGALDINKFFSAESCNGICENIIYSINLLKLAKKTESACLVM